MDLGLEHVHSDPQRFREERQPRGAVFSVLTGECSGLVSVLSLVW